MKVDLAAANGISDTLRRLVGHEVVLDTAGPTVYLGRLLSIEAEGFWLEAADVHNASEGHAPREQYIAEAARDGIRPNREHVFVFRHVVISLSLLTDVLTH